MGDLDEPPSLIPDYIVENARTLALAFAREDAVVVVCTDKNGQPVFTLGCINKEEKDGEWVSSFAPFARMFDHAEEVDELQVPTIPSYNALQRRPKAVRPDTDEYHRNRAAQLAAEAEARRRLTGEQDDM